ncbi:MAG: helix-turn-helix domain-containing protein [Candidatus Omnitrophica bacterium]|nr:helix-turn-helix domain-containing protein [Candidatus Omnitrophota bacterium]MDD5574319.1 helix-turn-helix domain-containing protein [Candidatus Omnitrophota bacterium]
MADREILEAKEVADYLHLHIFTVHKLAREGRLPAFKIGHGWRFRKAALDEWIRLKEGSIKNRAARKTPLKKGVFY